MRINEGVNTVREGNKQVSQETMLNYLQMMLTAWKLDVDRYGRSDRQVQKDLDRMCACKSMVETLIGVPVNLEINGRVTVGF